MKHLTASILLFAVFGLMTSNASSSVKDYDPGSASMALPDIDPDVVFASAEDFQAPFCFTFELTAEQDFTIAPVALFASIDPVEPDPDADAIPSRHPGTIGASLNYSATASLHQARRDLHRQC